MNKKPIGFFDSGVGGLSVMAEVHRLLPQEDLIYMGDSAYAPYGSKEKKAVMARSEEMVSFLMEKGAKAIVVACNTATSAAVEALRERFDIPIIGMEPALKVAIDRGADPIVVLATEMTLAEAKFQSLVERVAQRGQVIKRPAPELVTMVEKGVVRGPDLDRALDGLFTIEENRSPQAIVLGCTHFVFLKSAITQRYPDADVIDGNEGVAKQLKRILTEKAWLNETTTDGIVSIENTAGDEMVRRSWALFAWFRIEEDRIRGSRGIL